ncbi:MAG: DUF3572 domain-containing protein [Hyphomicrobiales bacterium]|nr:DUF3572 domain-containing protein [Hyphomicrobiales bacterium]MBV9434062.1 DUF3572 domain-containing protein [Hyphomicrobiales bacterium]
MPKLKVNSKNFMKSNRHPLPPPRQRAQAYALDALIYLAKDEEEMGRFLGETGFDPTDLRKMAEDPGFAGAMLDYLCSHESLLMAFARFTRDRSLCNRECAAVSGTASLARFL